MGTELPLPKGAQPTNFRRMSIVAKRSPISATVEHLLTNLFKKRYCGGTVVVGPVLFHLQRSGALVVGPVLFPLQGGAGRSGVLVVGPVLFHLQGGAGRSGVLVVGPVLFHLQGGVGRSGVLVVD